MSATLQPCHSPARIETVPFVPSCAIDWRIYRPNIMEELGSSPHSRRHRFCNHHGFDAHRHHRATWRSRDARTVPARSIPGIIGNLRAIGAFPVIETSSCVYSRFFACRRWLLHPTLRSVKRGKALLQLFHLTFQEFELLRCRIETL